MEDMTQITVASYLHKWHLLVIGNTEENRR